jgi:biopolymer transport protein ExbD
MGMAVGDKKGLKADINVTPMVDVVLVLLIIFMVVTPMLQKGQAVKLPLTAEPMKVPEDSKQLLVVVNEKKEYWIEKDKMTEEQFDGQIREAYQRNPGSSIVIKADSRLEYGIVKKVMLAIRDAGFQQVGLVTMKRQQAG